LVARRLQRRERWAIGGDADYDDPEAQDAADAEVLFDTLEQSIVPLYYDVDSRTGISTGWMRMVKESIAPWRPCSARRAC